MTKPKFTLGQLVATPRALRALEITFKKKSFTPKSKIAPTLRRNELRGRRK